MTPSFPLRPRGAGETAFGLWAAVSTLWLLVQLDRPWVLFAWDPVALPWVTVLWAKDLGLAAAACVAAVALLRATARLDDVPTTPGLARGRAAAALLAVVVLGALLRCAFVDSIPPGAWADAVYETEPAFRDPSSVRLAGGVPWEWDGRQNSTVSSGLYLAFSRGVFDLLGRNETGIAALSLVPASLLPAAAGLLAGAALGPAEGLAAAALLAFCRWPLAFSGWAATPGALALATCLAATGLVLALRTGSKVSAFAGGLAAGLAAHTYSAFPALLAALALFFLAGMRDPSRRRLALPALAGATLPIALLVPFYVGRPDLLGGRMRDVSVARGFSSNPALAPLGDLGRTGHLAENVLQYGGLVPFSPSPAARHGLPGVPVLDPVLGVAAALGVALGARRAARGSAVDGLLVAITGVSLLAGVLSESHYSPNPQRVFLLVGPLLVLGARVVVLWGRELARLLRARAPLVAGLGLALLLAVETGPWLVAWPSLPATVDAFDPEETGLSRTAAALAPLPLVLEPDVFVHAAVLELLARPCRGRDPVPRLRRAGVAGLLAAPPAGPFWYAARPESLDQLRSAGWAAARGVAAEPARCRGVLARVVPPGAALPPGGPGTKGKG